jgi:flavin reductase (DIM6/NTAB) family NADH-FMN oxidoreductase RutF
MVHPLLNSEVGLAIDRSEIRKALGNFATGVTVITTRVGGEFYGLTANSFTSIAVANIAFRHDALASPN